MSPEGNVLFQKYQADTFNANVWLAQIEPISSAVVNNQVTVKLPQNNCSLQFNYKEGRQEPGIYAWYGSSLDDNTQNQSCSANEFAYYRDSLGHYGHFIVDDQYFEIMPIENDYVVVIRDKLSQQVKACGMINSTSSIVAPSKDSSLGAPKSSSCSQEARLRLAIVFTPAARDITTDIEALAISCILESQQILRNSNIGVAELNLQLATIELVNFVESSDPKSDVDAWNLSTEIAEIRTRTDADLVMVLTDNVYTVEDQIVSGVVSGFGPDPNQFTGLVTVSNALRDKIFVHELGHLLGGRHRDDEPDGALTTQNAHTLQAGFWNVKYGTAIAQRSEIIPNPVRSGTAAKRRLLQYSDPNQEFRNEPTGESGDTDVAEFIRQNGMAIANYIDNGDFSTTLNIQGSWRACPCQTTSYTASINNVCGESVGPVNYVWEVSYDNVNYSVVSTGPSFGLSPPCSETSYITMRVTATTQDNTFTTTRTAYANPNSFGCSSFSPLMSTSNGENTVSSEFEDFDKYSAYPNPSSKGETITVTIPRNLGADQATIKVYDQLYRLVSTRRYHKEYSTLSSFKILGQNLVNGINFISISHKSSAQEFNHSMIINVQ